MDVFPLRNYIVVKRVEPEKLSESLVVIEHHPRDQQMGDVIALGKDVTADLSIGERVLFNTGSCDYTLETDDGKLMITTELDILFVFEEVNSL